MKVKPRGKKRKKLSQISLKMEKIWKLKTEISQQGKNEKSREDFWPDKSGEKNRRVGKEKVGKSDGKEEKDSNIKGR